MGMGGRWTAVVVIAVVAALAAFGGVYWGVGALRHGASSDDSSSGGRSPGGSGSAVSTVLLPVVACKSTYGMTGGPSPAYPAAESMALPSRLVGKVALYSNSDRWVRPILAPVGWDCSVEVAVDGGEVVNVFPPGGSGNGPMLVTADSEPACTSCIYDSICPLIPYAAQMFPGYQACPPPAPGRGGDMDHRS